jgi:signal transduction histidine kinase
VTAQPGSAARWPAGLLAGYTVVAVATAGLLAQTAPRPSHPGPFWPVIVASAVITGTACLLLLRLPGHGITRVVTVIAAAGPTASWLGALSDHTSGAAQAVLERLVNVAWIGEVPILALLILLFPTGRPPGPRWVPVLRVQVVALGMLVAAALAGAESRPAQIVAVAAAGALLATAGAAVVSLVARWRRADPGEQAGIRAFAVVAVGLVGWYVVGSALVAVAGVPAVGDAAFTVLAVGLPVAVGYGVLRHRLYGIDVFVRRAVVWLLVSAALLGTYLTVATLVTAMAGDTPGAALIAAGLVVLVLAPLSRIAQAAVDRLFYGRRGDPARVLVLAGRSLATAGASAQVPQRLVDLVAATMRLPWACVELDREGGWEPVATAGSRDLSGGPPVTIPVVSAGEEPARLLVQPRRGEQLLSRADRRLLDELAAQVAPALLSVRLVDELERSRERLLAARRDEREHLRRDLHDTLSPALNGMRLAVTAARGLLRADPDRADDLLASVSGTTDETAESVRRMLTRLRSEPVHEGDDVVTAVNRGVAQVARAGGLTVEVRADIAVPVLPSAVTDAVYRIAVEAVTNAARHADAQHCTVLIKALDEVTVEVRDDGRGLPDPIRPGVGFESMTARAAEVGGHCDVRTLGAGGTRVRAVLPLGGAP